MAMTISTLVSNNLHFYIPTSIIRNYKHIDATALIVDWSKNTENQSNYRVQIKDRVNEDSSTGDYYIIRQSLEQYLEYFNSMIHLYPQLSVKDIALNYFKKSESAADYICLVRYPDQYDVLEKYIAVQADFLECKGILGYDGILDYDGTDIYLKISSRSNGYVVVKVLKAYKRGTEEYEKHKHRLFDRKVIARTRSIKEIRKWFIVDEDALCPDVPDLETHKSSLCNVEPDYKAYYERYLVMQKELMEAKEIIYKQTCEIYDLKAKLR